LRRKARIPAASALSLCIFNRCALGGVVSPLLANIALHGMEEAIGVKYDYRGQLIGKRAVVRYADDFVCFCETKEDAEHV